MAPVDRLPAATYGCVMRAAVRVAICAAFLAAAPLAGAAPQRVATVSGLTGELQFLGARVAWLEQTVDSWAVLAAAPGESPALLASGRLVPAVSERGSASFEEVRFAISERRMAIVDRSATGSAKYMSYVWRADLLTGALGEPLASVEGCSGTHRPISNLGLDGDVLVYTRCGSGVGVRDYRPGAPVPSRTFDYPSPDVPELAGRFLAVSDWLPERVDSDVVLLDWTTGAELVRVSSPTYDFVADYDVLPDGTLVAIRATGPLYGSGPCLSPMRIVVYTPPSMAERVLPGRPCFGGMAVAGGRVAYIAQTGPDRVGLGTVSFAGETREIADLGHPQMLIGARLAFDGERAAYALATCDGRAQISVATVADTPSPETVGCPLTVESRRARIRRGHVTVKLRCPDGCSGSARLVRRARGIGYAPFAYEPSTRERSLRLPLARRARRMLARRHRMRTRLEVTLQDRGRYRVVRSPLMVVRAALP
jgi:hypothetical protein